MCAPTAGAPRTAAVCRLFQKRWAVCRRGCVRRVERLVCRGGGLFHRRLLLGGLLLGDLLLGGLFLGGLFLGGLFARPLRKRLDAAALRRVPRLELVEPGVGGGVGGGLGRGVVGGVGGGVVGGVGGGVGGGVRGVVGEDLGGGVCRGCV